MTPSPTERVLFVFALVASVVLCLGASWCIPMGNGADEPGHLDYAGYIWEHGSLPGIDALRHPQPTQQPFLYYAYVAAFRGLFPGPSIEHGPPLELPYERRVAIGRGPTPDPMRSQRVAAGAEPPMVSQIAPYVWRLSGLPLLVIVIFCTFRTARIVHPGAGATVSLAAATAVLVPPSTIAFATITNDQFAILLGSLGFAPVAIGAARGSLPMRRILAAGVVLGLGFLSKSTMAGAFTSAAFVVFFHAPRPLAARVRDVALLAMPSALGAAWWYVSRILETGHTDFVLAVGAAHPQLLRAVAPDWLGYVDTLAGTLLSWVGLVGPAISPGNLFLVIGATLPVLTVGGSIGAAFSASTSRQDRVVVGAFLAGLAVLVGLLVSGTTYSYLIHGRHLLNLVVPGTLAAVVALRFLFGRRARQVLAAALTWFAITDLALLHGAIVPLFHPPHDRFASPDLAAYVDAGALWAAPFAERGAPRAEPTWAPRPEGTVIADPEEVRLRIAGLDPAGTYLAAIRVHPLSRAVEAQDFWADELRLGGTVTPIGVRDWLRFPIPRAATADGAVSIGARSLAGGAEIAEVLVTRLPLEIAAPAVIDGDTLHVILTSAAPDRLPSLAARVRGGGGSPTPPRPVVFSNGRCDLAIPLDASLTGGLELLLAPPPFVWADLKIAPLVRAPARHAVHQSSPGFDVASVPQDVAPGTTVLRLLGMKLPPGSYRTEFLDERSRPIAPGVLALALPDAPPVDAAGAVIDVQDSDALTLACDVVFTGSAPVFVDRLRLLHAAPWVFDLGLTR